MAIDPEASKVATSALQAIPFSSLIGGPLDACIEAQAKAAKTTWEFIKQVGLNEDANKQRSAINVTFGYQRDGQMMNLVVPLLTIVPIPYIAITDISIAFKAKISAESSSFSETKESSNAHASGSLGGSVGWGPFSANFNMKAGYSSKKDSTATQSSKYSVEYTMDVNVKAGQDSMPAGLATVLNILQSSISTSDPKGALLVSAATVPVASGTKSTLVVTVRDGQGMAKKDVPVTLTAPTGFTVTPATPNNDKTGADGTLTLTIELASPAPTTPATLTLKANSGTADLAQTVQLVPVTA